MRAKWIGDNCGFFSKGTEYHFDSVNHLTVSTLDDRGDEHECDRNQFSGKDWAVTSGDFKYSQKTDDTRTGRSARPRRRVTMYGSAGHLIPIAALIAADL